MRDSKRERERERERQTDRQRQSGEISLFEAVVNRDVGMEERLLRTLQDGGLLYVCACVCVCVCVCIG